jgi:hypothetical protein
MAWRLFAMLLVPLGIAIFGFIRAGIRRREASAYRAQTQNAGNGR